METPDPKYKHKPSEKHTLEEVLKSLQDMIRNDLSEGTPHAKQPEAAVESIHRADTAQQTAQPRPPRESAPGVREDFSPASPASGPVNLDAVMRSLKDLIGNELNVGDEPAPASAKPASVHEEFLAFGEKIEEYVPEEFSPPDADLSTDDASESEPPESPSPADKPVAAAEEFEEHVPDEFTPLDEELTFDETMEAAPPPPALSETPELPGEILPEMLGEPEATPLPAVTETAPATEEDVAPGTQHEMFLEDLPTSSREPEIAPPVSVSVSTPEPEPIPEIAQEPAAEETQPPAEDALPTIEVEESFDANDYFDTAAPAAESPLAESEETVALDVEISTEPEQASPPADAIPATVPDSPTAAEPPPALVEKKVSLEIVDEPVSNSPGKASVDFDALSLEPSQPEQAPPPVATDVPAPEVESPAIAAEPDTSPVAEAETLKAPEETPAIETNAETAPEAEQPPVPVEPGAMETPPAFSLDDIPVLNEVVAPPAGSMPVGPGASPNEPPLPAPDRARDIVVRAVAKLNVEMRKTGGAGLDTKTILRLQQLIRQELEKGGGK